MIAQETRSAICDFIVIEMQFCGWLFVFSSIYLGYLEDSGSNQPTKKATNAKWWPEESHTKDAENARAPERENDRKKEKLNHLHNNLCMF